MVSALLDQIFILTYISVIVTRNHQGNYSIGHF